MEIIWNSLNSKRKKRDRLGGVWTIDQINRGSFLLISGHSARFQMILLSSEVVQLPTTLVADFENSLILIMAPYNSSFNIPDRFSSVAVSSERAWNTWPWAFFKVETWRRPFSRESEMANLGSWIQLNTYWMKLIDWPWKYSRPLF